MYVSIIIITQLLLILSELESLILKSTSIHVYRSLDSEIDCNFLQVL